MKMNSGYGAHSSDRQLMNLELACSLQRSPQAKWLAKAPGGFQPFKSTATTNIYWTTITVRSEPLGDGASKAALSGYLEGP